jgi:hypothetical protein
LTIGLDAARHAAVDGARRADMAAVIAPLAGQRRQCQQQDAGFCPSLILVVPKVPSN